MTFLDKVYEQFIEQAKHPIRTGAWIYIVAGLVMGFLLASCTSNTVSSFNIGDCVEITGGPFTGYAGLIKDLTPDNKYTVRFCDTEVCLSLNVLKKNLKHVEQERCKND